MTRASRCGKKRGVMLLEAMLAVAIFAIGVITLGRCVSNCIAAERLVQEDALARRALENRWAEIESGAVLVSGRCPAALASRSSKSVSRSLSACC